MADLTVVEFDVDDPQVGTRPPDERLRASRPPDEIVERSRPEPFEPAPDVSGKNQRFEEVTEVIEDEDSVRGTSSNLVKKVN